MASSIELIKENSNVNIFNVKFNTKLGEISIKPNYIQNYELCFDGTMIITGFITINDHYDIVNNILDYPGMEFELEIIDVYKEKHKRNFIVTLSEEQKEQSFKMIKLYFQDIISFKLDNIFISKSYKKSTLINIFNEFYSNEYNSIDKNIKLFDGSANKEITVSNFILPQNISLLKFLINEFKRRGIFFYQSRNEIVIGDKIIEETPESPFIQSPENPLYGFNIMEYYAAFNNILDTRDVPRTQWMGFNKDTKSFDYYKETFEDLQDRYKLNSNDKIQKQDLTINHKFSTKEYLINSNEYNYINQKNNTILTIFVPGNLNINILYKNIDVKLTGNPTSTETTNSGDVKLSGKYTITKIEDKFIAGQKFVQKLTLKKVGEGTSPNKRIK